MISKPATTDHAIHPLLAERWSPRAFGGQPIAQGQLLSLFEAARWAPSAGNGQPWRFIAFTQSDAESFAQALSCLDEGNAIWAKRAPLLVLCVAETVRDNGKQNRTALYDLGQSVAHLTVQATSLGLWLHQMAGFSIERATELFGIPERYEPVTFIAIGPQGDAEALPDGLRDRERGPRARRPLDQFVFAGAWGAPIQG